MSSKSVTSDKSPSSDAKIYTLRESRQTCVVRELKDDMITTAFHLISDAVERGENVGVDEIPDVEFLQFVIEFGTAWCFTDLNTGQLNCLLIIAPCRFARSQHPILGQATIVTSHSFSDRTHLRDLAEIACGFAVRDGFGACVIEVFATCIQHMLAFRDEGFLVTCVVPEAGKLAKQKDFVASYVMYKDLCTGDLPFPVPDPELEEDLIGFKPDMRQVDSPYLPLHYHMSNGADVILRAMREEELQDFYEALRIEARAANGYGFDELPNFEYFCRWYIHEFYNFTIEERSTGKIIGFQNFGPSLYSRTQSGGVLMDGNNLILSEFRGKKFSEELCLIQDCISSEMGFRFMFGETATTNLPSIVGFQHIGITFTGTIPKAIYFENQGWIDLVTMFKRFPASTPSLKNLVSKDLRLSSKL